MLWLKIKINLNSLGERGLCVESIFAGFKSVPNKTNGSRNLAIIPTTSMQLDN